MLGSVKCPFEPQFHETAVVELNRGEMQSLLWKFWIHVGFDFWIHVLIKVEFEVDKNSRKSIVPSHKTGQIKLESAIDSSDCSCDMLPSFKQPVIR